MNETTRPRLLALNWPKSFNWLLLLLLWGSNELKLKGIGREKLGAGTVLQIAQFNENSPSLMVNCYCKGCRHSLVVCLCLATFICSFNPVALGSNQMHTIYAFFFIYLFNWCNYLPFSLSLKCANKQEINKSWNIKN